MRAAVLHEQPGELAIEDLRIDHPGPGEVLVDVHAAGLCHSDLHFMQGKFRTPLPAVLGHESAGVVREVGEGVRHVAEGDHVVCCLSLFCGECNACVSGRPFACTDTGRLARRGDATPRLAAADGSVVKQFSHLGGFAEQMLVHERAVVRIADDIPLDRAALVGCGVLTGTGAVFRTARVEPGASVAVIGAGGIGLSAIQGARIAGAGTVIAVDVTEDKLATARRFGATQTVNAGEVDDVVAAVRDLTGGGVDYSFEAIGAKPTAEQAFRMVNAGGLATIIGMVPSNQPIEVRGMDLLAGRRLQGTTMGSNRFRIDIPRLLDMYRDGRLLLDEVISERIDLDQINAGYDELQRGTLTRSVIVFDDSLRAA
jgi:S-(hydroxymethyl)glutathione dehydrogenase / alcohol dehydrogenase